MSTLKNTGKHIPKIRGNEGLMGKEEYFWSERQEQDRQLEESV